ncbi:MAG: hypothetical protein POG74_12780, partial [Acidocella sp.]|nr:hypothetical protein [Acidocella sp.]
MLTSLPMFSVANGDRVGRGFVIRDGFVGTAIASRLASEVCHSGHPFTTLLAPRHRSIARVVALCPLRVDPFVF